MTAAIFCAILTAAFFGLAYMTGGLFGVAAMVGCLFFAIMTLANIEGDDQETRR